MMSRTWLPIVACLLPVSPAAAQSGGLAFVDVAREAGIDFRHRSPFTPERHIHLFMGSGLAWGDFDRDGRLDLYCCQGRPFDANADPPGDCLYRNLTGERFANVSGQAGLGHSGYSMGAAVGDYDNDGFPDLHVSCFGANQLYRNNGDGTFEKVSVAAGIADDRYGASCTWLDAEGDADLDLYVTNYVRVERGDYRVCSTRVDGREVSISCQPRSLTPAADVFYVNNGDGTFHDASDEAGFADAPARQGLGVTAADFDGDHDTDLYVANDSVPNQFWENAGNGRFVERGLLSGTALNRDGAREAGMGVSVADVDGDSRLDLFVTNYFDETNTLYRNEGHLLFLDVTREFGLAAPSRFRLSFGTLLTDADNDGDPDLFVANGHVQDHEEVLKPNEHFEQRPQFFLNDGGRRFRDVSDAESMGRYFRSQVVGRGCAAADFNGDGALDIAVGHLNGPAALLENRTRARGHALRVRLVGTTNARDGVGATVRVETAGRTLVQPRTAGNSYLSCNEGVLHFGLADEDTAERVIVSWPNGRRDVWTDLAAGLTHRLVEGEGAGE